MTKTAFFRAPKKDGNVPAGIAELCAMMTYMRPGGTNTEQDFINRFILPLGATRDAHANYWRVVGDSPDIMFSCHTDTVHREEGRQRLVYGDHALSLSKNETKANCLGADCTTGVWLCMEMIRANVPGVYIFHASEEAGGAGSSAIALHSRERLRGSRFAIAFDRKGYTDIITHQMPGRTCSDAFATSLAEVLRPMQFSSCDRGTFTDTANYEHLIPECTNVSVGYHNQHTGQEWQNTAHALSLRDRLIAADWSQLVCQRDPTLADPWEDFGPTSIQFGWGQRGEGSNTRRDFDELVAYVKRNPTAVAGYLHDMGATPTAIEYFTYGDDLDDKLIR